MSPPAEPAPARRSVPGPSCPDCRGNAAVAPAARRPRRRRCRGRRNPPRLPHLPARSEAPNIPRPPPLTHSLPLIPPALAGSGRPRSGRAVTDLVGDPADVRHEQFRKALRRPGQLAGGGAHLFVGRGGNQLGLRGGERPGVPVHEPLAGRGALHVKVGQERHYFGPCSHEAVPSTGCTCSGCTLQPSSVSYPNSQVATMLTGRPAAGTP